MIPAALTFFMFIRKCFLVILQMRDDKCSGRIWNIMGFCDSSFIHTLESDCEIDIHKVIFKKGKCLFLSINALQNTAIFAPFFWNGAVSCSFTYKFWISPWYLSPMFMHLTGNDNSIVNLDQENTIQGRLVYRLINLYCLTLRFKYSLHFPNEKKSKQF